MLEQRDGYDLAPWRLSLRNNHKDPIKNLAQKVNKYVNNLLSFIINLILLLFFKDVARFLLAKAFSGKVEIDNNSKAKISIHLFYKIKNWIERARQRVYFVHGICKSSYRKRPFNKGGLCGNKVLIDGFNNNFREAPNAYERLRKLKRHYYFIDYDGKLLKFI